MTVTIQKTEAAYRGWLKVHRVTLAGADGEAFTREVEDHGPGVAVLPYCPATRMALLVRLPRAPVMLGSEGSAEHLLEVPAGLRDGDEAPAEGARREAHEEAGVALKALDHLGTIWSMPGISTERMDLFLAAYAPEDRTGAGGGLAAEHENITVAEVSLGDLAALADRGALTDMKTLVLVQTLRLRRPELF